MYDQVNTTTLVHMCVRLLTRRTAPRVSAKGVIPGPTLLVLVAMTESNGPAVPALLVENVMVLKTSSVVLNVIGYIPTGIMCQSLLCSNACSAQKGCCAVTAFALLKMEPLRAQMRGHRLWGCGSSKRREAASSSSLAPVDIQSRCVYKRKWNANNALPFCNTFWSLTVIIASAVRRA